MAGLRLVLRAIAPVFLVVAALHITLGVGADVLLGARLPPAALTDPALDSQNRFYGASVAVYAVLLWICASDIAKYARILRALMLVFLGAGRAGGVDRGARVAAGAGARPVRRRGAPSARAPRVARPGAASRQVEKHASANPLPMDLHGIRWIERRGTMPLRIRRDHPDTRSLRVAPALPVRVPLALKGHCHRCLASITTSRPCSNADASSRVPSS
jgi:hypothetical protein